ARRVEPGVLAAHGVVREDEVDLRAPPSDVAAPVVEREILALVAAGHEVQHRHESVVRHRSAGTIRAPRGSRQTSIRRPWAATPASPRRPLGEPRPRADPRGWTDRAEPSPRPAPPLDRQLTRHHEHDSTARSPEVPSITAGAKRPHARAEPPLRAHLRGMSPLAPRARCEGFRGDPRLAGSPCAVKTVLVST